MTSSYQYRVFKSAWPIVVGIECNVETSSRLSDVQSSELVQITPNFYLAFSVDNNFAQEWKDILIAHLVRGLKMIVNLIPSEFTGMVIEIISLTYNEVDFHPEALTNAIIGWASQEFGFDYDLPEPFFDKDNNRYVFDFNESKGSEAM